MDKEKERVEKQEQDQQVREEQSQQRSGAFNEQSTRDIKSTTNIEDIAAGEQDRKDAMTERD